MLGAIMRLTPQTINLAEYLGSRRKRATLSGQSCTSSVGLLTAIKTKFFIGIEVWIGLLAGRESRDRQNQDEKYCRASAAAARACNPAEPVA